MKCIVDFIYWTPKAKKQTTMKIFLFILITSFSLTVVHSQHGWKYQNPNLAQNQYGAICPISKDVVYVIADKGKFLKINNGGTNWITQSTGFTASFFDLSFCNSDTGFAVGEKGSIIKTIDGGGTWSSLTSNTKSNLFSISTKNPNSLWVVGDSGTVLNSKDYGITWTKYNSSTNNLLNSVRFRNSSVGFIAGNKGTILGTVNGGIAWTPLTITTTKDLFSLSVTDNNAYLLAGQSSYGTMFHGNEIFKTNNNINWASQSTINIINGCASLYFPNDSLGFISASGCTTNSQCFLSISKTQDHAKSWAYSLMGGMPSNLAPGVQYSKMYFVTDSIGYAFSGACVLKTIDGGAYTFVIVKELNDEDYFKIHPNPFSITTTLQTDKALEDATLVVFNFFGQVVKQINNLSGQEIVLHRDNLPGGLYFVRLMQGDEVIATEKLIITDN
jgi:hypothetical protein